MTKKISTLIIFATILFGCGQKAESESKEVLFVCTHGAARSPIAAAYFNKIAEEKGLNYHAVSRGTEPDDVLAKVTIDGLTEDNFEVSGWKPQKVTDEDVKKASKIITFDCSVPTVGASSLNEEQWNGIPSVNKDFDIARNAIKEKVEQLIETLHKE